ncbi:MAG: hypothetical protein HQK76_01980 [Desulfobacterales bacterium]|nr:hypothetical protein [Desulfobacterales bacterium]
MIMESGGILILFEDKKIRNESLLYGVELAKRMKSDVSILMLIDGVQKEESLLLNFKIDDIILKFKQELLKISITFTYGDKVSELFKFLAKNPRFKTLIWGGNEAFFSGRRPKPSQYWFSKVIDYIECPIVTPTLKTA